MALVQYAHSPDWAAPNGPLDIACNKRPAILTQSLIQMSTIKLSTVPELTTRCCRSLEKLEFTRGGKVAWSRRSK
jgi:hypothetical protein